MSDKVQKIKQEIEERIEQCYRTLSQDLLETERKETNCCLQQYKELLQFIDSLPEEPCCKIDLTAENENKMFEEIDRYCTLCMDINCFGCEYHDIHFRNIIKDGTIH